ncbi:MAG: CDC48 family AAA ATPase [bacterium]
MSPEISLKVSEAQSGDVGRGLARIDPADMKRLGVSVGDVVQVCGKRTTAAKIMPAYPEARGRQSVQFDGLTRRNAGVAIGEKVDLKPATSRPATHVVLAPANGRVAFQKEKDMSYVGKLLNDLPVVKDDVIRATFFGSRFQEFTVLDLRPDGVGLIQPQTRISIKQKESAGTGKAGISYEDIGGLNNVVQRVREMIELPLKYPQVFEKLGIDAPKGVLLHGPPGCGKTLLARAVASETDANFFSVSGPEIIHKFYGQSEARLREIFDTASKKAPSIIFLDELDSIAPKRDQVVGDVEKRVVAQLLALMDGLEGRGEVIVIGATNLPNMLDMALRRPGRFDREIFIGIPDTTGRRKILEIHTRGMPLADDVDLDKVAEITHGFTGADLAALCREAAMITLRKIIPEIDFDMDTIPYDLLQDLTVNPDDFISALKEVEPSAIREVFVEMPDVTWQDVGGLEEIKERLVEAVEWPLKHRALFKHAKLRAPKGILLHGPPGCGKTLIAKAVAKELGINFISIKGPELISKYVGESERGVREIFKKARYASPCIVFFDEIDAIAPVRVSGGGDSHVADRVVSQILTEMDGIVELKEVWVLAATNRKDMVDPALLRPGRFDLILELPAPDEKARLAILEVHAKGKPLADDVALTELAKETDGMSGAEIEAFCREATMQAIRNFIYKNEEDIAINNYEAFEIAQNHFQEVRSRQCVCTRAKGD